MVRKSAFEQAGKYGYAESGNTMNPYRTKAANQNLTAIARNRVARLAAEEIAERLPEEMQQAAAKAQNATMRALNTTWQAMNTAKGLTASAEIAYPVAMLYIPQFLFALLFMATYYVEQDWWFVAWVVPGELLLGLSWIVIICIGIISMTVAALAFNRLLINSTILITWFICFAGYFAPYIFIVPWVIIFMFVVNFVNVLNTANAVRGK